MRLKAIVLDMDGTITRFNLDFMSVRRQALEELDKLNLRTPEMTEQFTIYRLLRGLKETVDPEKLKKFRETFYNLLERMETKAGEEVTLYPGVLETLKNLRSRGIHIGIVTNNGRAGTRLTLERNQLTSYFDAVVTRDDCEEMKPDGGPVRKVLADMHVQPEEAILVGDGAIDVIAARAVGSLSAAVATGPIERERLLQTEPDYLLGSVNDLSELIEWLEASKQ